MKFLYYLYHGRIPKKFMEPNELNKIVMQNDEPISQNDGNESVIEDLQEPNYDISGGFWDDEWDNIHGDLILFV